MADLYLQEDAEALLANKKVVIIGDSNMRALYKDLLTLIMKNSLTSQKALKTKLESAFCNDRLVYRGQLNNGRDFREEREFRQSPCHINFFFVTHCYDDYMENKVIKFMEESRPDIVIMNSCLWDITRWGVHGVENYKSNLKILMERLKSILRKDALFVWTTTMPVSQDMKGGFLIPQVEFLRHQLRFEIMEANLYAWKTVSGFGFDILDLHYYLQLNIKRRARDGVHWSNNAMRHITNYVLTHIGVSLGIELPGYFKNAQLDSLLNDGPLKPPIDDTPISVTTAVPSRKLLRPFRRRNDRR